jgi:hypothetical protein
MAEAAAVEAAAITRVQVVLPSWLAMSVLVAAVFEVILTSTML